MPQPISLVQVYKKINEEKPETELVKDEQDLITGLLEDPRWKALQKVIDQRIEFLKQLIDPLSGKEIIGADDTPEVVGFRFLIASTVIRYLQEIRNYPEILFEALKNEREQQGGTDNK